MRTNEQETERDSCLPAYMPLDLAYVSNVSTDPDADCIFRFMDSI
jgi:hypothetical protein